jgi:hypothetical protein
MTAMNTYWNKLNGDERQAVEWALNELRDTMQMHGVKLDNGDHAARAAEALAVYIVESRRPVADETAAMIKESHA